MTLLEKIKTDYEQYLEANWMPDGTKRRESIEVPELSAEMVGEIQNTIRDLKATSFPAYRPNSGYSPF